MHIQEGTNTTLTTCSKMTEEVDRRHGVNGNSSSKAVSEDAPVHNSAINATGGRLKFFKDGKFILELVRGCGREGERPGWVSVPRKTFWPPAAAPATPPAGPHPPSASLSVSDDNSSVHSSPWQRDHCWKQTSPRKNLSKELAMYYCRPSTLTVAAIEALSRLKRRRPYDATHLDPAPVRRPLTNGVCDQRKNGDSASPSPEGRPRGEDAVDVAARTFADDDPWTDYDREKYYHMKLKKRYQYRKLRVYKKTRPAFRRKDLARTINKLLERPAVTAAMPVPVNAKLASCRAEHTLVSPRKRILRELERVSLEDQGTKRRAKTAPALSTASYPPSPGPSHTARSAPVDPPRCHSAASPHAPRKEAPPPAPTSAPAPAPPTKNVSSYSIHSLLSMPDESGAEAKRSPHSHCHTPSLKTESPSSVTSPDLSPSPDSYRHRYASAGEVPYRAGVGAGYASAGAGYGGAYGREWAYAYPYGYMAAAAHVYRAPPAPLWMHYVPAAPAPAPAPGAWAPLALPLLTDHIPKDEPTSDLPLNLSKH